MRDEFEAIYESARASVGQDGWLRLAAHEQTEAIYRELHILDARNGGSLRRPRIAADGTATFGATDQSVVRLRLSGQMQAWTISGGNVLPAGRKTRALLAAIALSAPRPALRGRLAEMLWSRRPEEQARASLRQEIQLLLKALAPAKTEVLHVTRDHLSLAPGAMWVDVEQILRATTPRPAALSLLDRELLEDLDGIDPSFDMWLTSERERVRDRARGMAESLLREQTEPASIVAAAQRLLQIDRAHEEAWRALMRAHADQGERGMAIQAFDRCRGVLAELLDAAPSAETQALLNELRGPSSKRLPSRPPRPVPEAPSHGVSEPATAAFDMAERDEPGPRGGASIGVLPLRCVGLTDDVAYLGPCLANELTMALSRFRWLSVVSSNSLARFGRDSPDGAAIRRARGVDFLLDGAIQRSRNKLRITMRLLDLREDNQVIWARRFDRPADDLMTVQEEVSSEVAAQIDPVMLLTEARRGSAYANVATSAYDHLLRSVPLIIRLERKGFMAAKDHLARAIVAEPDHSAAHAWFAVWHLLLISQGWAGHPGESVAQADELAERAIVLDPYSAGAFSVAGHVRAFIDRNPREAVVLHEHALELNPNLASAVALSAITHILLGETEQAERRYQRYKVLSPLDPYSFLFDGMFAFFHLLKRDHLAAAALGRAVTQLNPSYTLGYKPYLAALGHLGREQEAAVVLRRLMTMEPGITLAECLSAFPLVRPEDRAHFSAGLRLAGVV